MSEGGLKALEMSPYGNTMYQIDNGFLCIARDCQAKYASLSQIKM